MALVGGGRRADATGEEIAEAAEAGKAHFHADFGYRMLAAREEELRPVQARPDPILVRGESEEGFKPADEVEGRHAGVPCDFRDGEGWLAGFSD